MVATPDQLYSGIARIPVKSNAGFQEISSKLFANRTAATALPWKMRQIFAAIPELFPNQCCIFDLKEGETKRHVLALHKVDPQHGAYFTRRKTLEGKGNGDQSPQHRTGVRVRPTDGHRDPNGSASGIAGGGKTLMALLAGLNGHAKGWQRALRAGSGIPGQLRNWDSIRVS